MEKGRGERIRGIMRRDSSWDFYLAFAASPGYNDNVMLGVERQLPGSCSCNIFIPQKLCFALGR